MELSANFGEVGETMTSRNRVETPALRTCCLWSMPQCLVALVIVLVLGGGAGCSDENVRPATEERSDSTPNSERTAYSLKILVSENGEAPRLVKVRPMDKLLGDAAEVEGLSATTSSQQELATNPGLRTLVGPGDRVSIVQDGEATSASQIDGENGYAPGSTLMRYALLSCTTSWALSSSERRRPALNIAPSNVGPWSDYNESEGVACKTRNFLIRSCSSGSGGLGWGSSCGYDLATHEALVCAADRLAEIADSTGTVHWEIDYENYYQAYTNVSVTIPPQATADRFIARDMALNALSLVAADKWGGTQRDGCVEEHLSALRTGVADATNFGWEGYFGDVSDPSNPEYHRSRLAHRANLYAAAARLVRTLVDGSVRDDLATAERKRAKAADLIRGTADMWGVPTAIDDDSEYGSLRHAFRTITGRLEALGGISANAWDPDNGYFGYNPDCDSGVSPPSAKSLGYNYLEGVDEWEARAADVPAPTGGAAAALALVEKLGIVAIAEASSAAAVRDALEEAILLRLAAERAIAVTSLGDDVRSAATESMLQVADEDVAWAVRSVNRKYDLLVGDEDAPARSGVVPLDTSDSAYSPKVAALGGIQLKGGFPRSDLAMDPTGGVLAGLREEQCKVSMDESSFAGEARLNLGPVAALQNPFLLGESLRRRVQLIGEAADEFEFQDLGDFTRLVSAEIREWAAEGLIVAFPSKIVIEGVAPADVGSPSEQHLLDRVALVGDSPNMGRYAECLAGTRQTCPDDLLDEEKVSETLVVVPDGLSTTSVADYVIDGDKTINIPLPAEVSASAYTIVVRRSGATPGRILGVVKVPSEGSFFEVISPLRESLLRRIFDPSAAMVPPRSCRNTSSAALPSDYCIEGMSRDMFVPLANELTSSTPGIEDSWRHYLDLAEDAAAKADQLGRDLIEFGIARDVRTEGANESFADLCGVFPDAGSVGVGPSGQIAETLSDKAVNSCINEEKVDVVFLRRNPFSSATQLKEAFCTYGSHDFCVKDANEIEVAELGFDTRIPLQNAPATLDDACGDILAAVDPRDARTDASMPFNRARFDALLNKIWATPEGMMASLHRLRLREYDDGEWSLSFGMRPVIGTDAGTAWDADRDINDIFPACLDASGGCTGERAAFIREFFEASPTPGRADDLRRDLESAVFHLAAMAGQMPAGTVMIPTPAIRLGDPPAEELVQLPALYGLGRFAASGSVFHYSSPYLEDVAVMGEWGVPLPGYAESRVTPRSGPMVVPPWQNNLFDSGYDLLVRYAVNTPLTFDRYHYGTEERPRAYLDQALRAASRGFRGSCSDKQGMPSFIAAQLSESPVDGRASRESDKLGAGLGERAVCTSRVLISPAFYTYLDWGPEHSYSSYSAPSSDRLFVTNKIDWVPIEAGFFRSQWVSTRFDEPASFGRYGAWKTLQEGDCFTGMNFADWAHCLEESDNAANLRLNPASCSPEERVELFLYRDAQNDCEAMEALTRGLMLACVAAYDTATLGYGELPPPIQSVEEIRLLETWSQRAASAVQEAAGAIALVDVPKRVVAAVVGGELLTSATGEGEHGRLLLQLGDHLRDIESGFSDIAAAYITFQGEIQDARLSIESASLAEQQKLLAIARERIDLERMRAFDALRDSRSEFDYSMQFLGGVASGASQGAAAGTWGAVIGGIWGGAMAASQIVLQEQNARIDSTFMAALQENLAAQTGAVGNQTAVVKGLSVNDLSMDTAAAFQSMESALGSIRKSSSDALKIINSLDGNEAKARMALAKAGGADFVVVGNQTVPLYVNTVYRRQFDVLRERYERAVESAKRAAYLARLAIEQRLGARLGDIRQDIGPIDAPAVWVDDLCSLSGIDYNAMREAAEDGATLDEDGVATGGADEVDLIRGFADQYIGDYVSQLREFMEFYNVEYPFREADDVALVSLREDLASTLDECYRPSKNELFYSDRLEAAALAGDGNSSFGRWQISSCSSSACLRVESGATLVNDAQQQDEPLQPPENTGAHSWLYLEASGENDPVGEDGIPPWVYQSVRLQGGVRYILSWWDMARTPNGGALVPPADSAEPYQAMVFDEQWELVGFEAVQPSAGLGNPYDGEVWSARRQLIFTPPADGVFHVGFTASSGPGVPSTTLALANVQLERSLSDFPSAYESNGASRSKVSGSCSTDDPEVFRRRFQYRCDGRACYYELTDPLILDTEVINGGGSGLVGAVAQGNYNYRHRGLAVNVVGTGIVDCSRVEGASCYGSGYLEYDLEHFAGDVPVLDYTNEATCFDFGAGRIRSGKALAAERYLTLPLGSADRGLVGEPPILKTELVGRPLSGTYRLRIKDHPALVWENVEDVQLMVDYRYWSRVDRSY